MFAQRHAHAAPTERGQNTPTDAQIHPHQPGGHLTCALIESQIKASRAWSISGVNSRLWSLRRSKSLSPVRQTAIACVMLEETG